MATRHPTAWAVPGALTRSTSAGRRLEDFRNEGLGLGLGFRGLGFTGVVPAYHKSRGNYRLFKVIPNFEVPHPNLNLKC